MFFRVLSIDAWGNQEEGYEWNAWYKIGEVDLESDVTVPVGSGEILGALVDQGFLISQDAVELEDDGYNAVVIDRETREPLLAVDGFFAC
jgi:hypothetical protein